MLADGVGIELQRVLAEETRQVVILTECAT